MRLTRMYLAVAFAALILPGTASAVDINYQKGPFTFLTWPFQILWQVLSAPAEMAQGGINSANIFVMPPDRQIPPLEKWQMPKLTMPKLPDWLSDDKAATPGETTKTPAVSAKATATHPAAAKLDVKPKPASPTTQGKVSGSVPPSAKTSAPD